jgi:hypothetical protein
MSSENEIIMLSMEQIDQGSSIENVRAVILERGSNPWLASESVKQVANRSLDYLLSSKFPTDTLVLVNVDVLVSERTILAVGGAI